MPEQMTKQDAIEYLLYMKHDVQAKSPMDIALDTAIEALKQPTIEPEVRHGRWVFGSSKTSCWMTCSNCCKSQSGQTACFSYCPNCGARMDATDTNVGGEGGADNA